MKKITFILSLLITSIGFSQSLPLDFSDSSDLFAGVGGSVATIVANPAGCAGAGCSGNVLQIDGGPGDFTDPVELNLANYVDLTDSNNNTITLDFYAASAGNLLVQFSGAAQEGSENGFPIEINTPVVAGLNSLVLDFDTASNGFPNGGLAVTLDKYAKISLFVDFGVANLQQTHFVDNIAGGLDGGLVPSPISSLAVDFETASGFIGDGGLVFAEVVNPEINGTNPSATVAQVSDINVGAFVNAQLNVTGGFDLSSADRGFSMLVRGPRAIPIKVKLQGGAEIEKDGNYSGSGTWELVTFDFTGETQAGNSTVVIFFDITGAPSTSGSDDIFQFDDFVFDQFSTLSNDSFLASSFRVSPNPSNNVWNIEGSNSVIDNIEVYDLLGKRVLNLEPNSQDVRIDASALKTGIYLAKLSSQGATKTIKLVKN